MAVLTAEWKKVAISLLKVDNLKYESIPLVKGKNTENYRKKKLNESQEEKLGFQDWKMYLSKWTSKLVH